ncbi:MAG: Flp pilus assembly protein CpaB [Endomicrobium sp.]|jgi:pilus assembly protein CpaB|nr:Flp pilus assembly protein CpaB [Endomicrobium sp.]
MKRSIIIALICAIICGVLAYLFLSDLEIKYKSATDPIKVVVACQRIPQGILIEPNMLIEKIIPKEYMQPKAFQSLSDLFREDGSAIYISLNTIEENEQILSTKVSKTNQDTGISNLIPDTKKALSVSFDGESLGILTPGNRIDIYAIIEYLDNGKELQDIVFSVAQNILVLAVGESCIGAVKKSDQEDEDVANLNSVTVAVSVEETQKILIACEKGRLKYVVRPAGDLEISDIKPLKLSSMIKDISKISPNYTRDLKTANQREVLEIINKYTNINKQK